MYVCMDVYVCMYVCMYVCIYIFTHSYMYTDRARLLHTHMHVCVNAVCVYLNELFTLLSVYVYIYMYIQIPKELCIHVYTTMYMYICIDQTRTLNSFMPLFFPSFLLLFSFLLLPSFLPAFLHSFDSFTHACATSMPAYRSTSTCHAHVGANC